MPIYEYRCAQCGEQFETHQRITDDPLTEHEGCGGSVQRLISLTSFALRGDGWYSDHYGLKSSQEKKDAAGGSGKNGSAANGASKSSGGEGDATTKKKAAEGGSGKDGAKSTAKTSGGGDSTKAA